MSVRIVPLFFIGVFAISSYSIAHSSALLTDLRFWSAPDHTRVVLDLTVPVQYESSIQEKISQYRLELKKVSLVTKKRELKIDDSFVSKLLLTDQRKGNVTVVLFPKKPLNVNVSLLKPYLDKPHRLVIDLFDISQEKKEQEERQRQKGIAHKGTKIVVIDPGHGGEDPGAIGPRGTMEKDVVLEIGKKVIRVLNQSKDIRAFLTRKGDYFVPLEQRVKIAREYSADLFVSLHADAGFNPQARGTSAYCLSLSGATNVADRLLADRENMSNLLGGAVLRPASISRDPNLDKILIDLMQNNSLKQSLRFAEMFLREIETVNHLKYPSYRQANFIVLKAPDIPSILVEAAFITNKEEERLLRNNDFQNKLTGAMVNSIQRYFRGHSS